MGLDPRRIAGRDTCCRHLAGRAARAPARHAPAADPWHGHRPHRRAQAAATRRPAGLAALGYASGRAPFRAAIQASGRRAHGNRGLAQPGRHLPRRGRAAGAGQRATQRQITGPGAARGAPGAPHLCRAGRRLGADRGRCAAPAPAGRARARRARQPEIRCTSGRRAAGARPAMEVRPVPPRGAAGQQPRGRGGHAAVRPAHAGAGRPGRAGRAGSAMAGRAAPPAAL